MTIEERVNKALDAMGDDCYVFCCSEAESAYRDGFTDGATDQQKIDIEKACKVLSKLFYQANSEDTKEFLKKFKQAMEE